MNVQGNGKNKNNETKTGHLVQVKQAYGVKWGWLRRGIYIYIYMCVCVSIKDEKASGRHVCYKSVICVCVALVKLVCLNFPRPLLLLI